MWGYDLGRLKQALTPSTVAVVAVNLLGLGDQSAAVTSVVGTIPVIQDSAQFVPRRQQTWLGRHVVLSFGRGKALNLLHGGALVLPTGDHSYAITDRPGPIANVRETVLASRLAGGLFNLLTRPAPYWCLSKIPGTHLGETRFRPLHRISQLPERRWRQVAIAFDKFVAVQWYSAAIWSPALAAWKSLGIRSLQGPHGGQSADDELLRLPLLAPDSIARDALVRQLNRHGLGSSPMYGVALHELPDIPDSVRSQGPFPGATELARKLFTLPTHRLVDQRTVNAAIAVVASWADPPLGYPTKKS
jgi:dTDP-4-amino-4,6-dideoxygalactose transaminase